MLREEDSSSTFCKKFSFAARITTEATNLNSTPVIGRCEAR